MMIWKFLPWIRILLLVFLIDLLKRFYERRTKGEQLKFPVLYVVEFVSGIISESFQLQVYQKIACEWIAG